ncbi:hypothetical protein B0H14DRAFT_2633310 [Mycena olivaceomarginata]|nr:hypothetical protein B0H14DRAFT_2633310 [Mycena olivaceomarginata]
MLIWTGAEMLAIFWLLIFFQFVPEFYAPVLLKRKAARLRKETGDQTYWAPLDRHNTSLARSLLLSCSVPYTHSRTAHLRPNGFASRHMNVWLMRDRLSAGAAARHGGRAPPETLLIMGQVGGILVPISLYWFAFTTYPRVHWIVPIIASVPFGTGVFFVFTGDVHVHILPDRVEVKGQFEVRCLNIGISGTISAAPIVTLHFESDDRDRVGVDRLLPPELEQQTFEMAAELYPETIPNLLLVAARVLEW